MDDDDIHREIEEMFSCFEIDWDDIKDLSIHDPEIEYLKAVEDLREMKNKWEDMKDKDPDIRVHQDKVNRLLGYADTTQKQKKTLE